MASSSSLVHKPHRTFEVFINFRGEDTRNGFVSHLYYSLKESGIDTFIDEETLERGALVGPGLFEGIQESKLSIVVLSKNYASSTWCLKELTKILECQKLYGQKVVPIFYNIDPSDVRNHKGKFAKAFAEHEEKFKHEVEKVEEWKKAFGEVGNISGYDSRGRNESKLIKQIVSDISNKLHSVMPCVSSDLVGMGPIIEEIEDLLGLTSNVVRMLGIWGMGGIGKSTIAEVIYEKISNQFETHYFFNEIKDKCHKGGQVLLQQELLSKICKNCNFSLETVLRGKQTIKNRLSHKKVLIVLDDVDNSKQLEALVGNHDWFGPGSKIIIATREKQLLDQFKVEVIYKARVLDYHDAIELFTMHAFKQEHPNIEFQNLSKEIVCYCNGLPFALKVLGSFMCGKSTIEWKGEIEKLKSIPNEEIQNVLKLSYDGLDSLRKELFLDIACFFNGWGKHLVMEIFEACDLHPIPRMRVLVDKSLVTIKKENDLEIIYMHDLLQEMGKEIVRQEAVDHLGKRSQLYKYADIYNVFTKDMGTDGVKGISLCLAKYPGGFKEIHVGRNSFAKMSNIRLLNFRIYCSKDKLCSPNQHEVHLCKGPQFTLPSSLKYLHWHGFPLTHLPPDSSYENLKVLEILCSPIKKLWKGTQRLGNLIVLNLKRCPNLKKIPNLSGASELQKLILEGCSSLVKVHWSVGYLNKLIELKLTGCPNLKYFPKLSAREGSLQNLDLSWCSKLDKCPDISGPAKYLTHLILDGTSIKELSSTIINLRMLETISLKGCSKLRTLPDSIYKLKSLQDLSLSGCSKFVNFPEILETVPKLCYLDLSRTSITTLPSSICRLKSLRTLELVGCSKLSNFPEISETMPELYDLDLSGTSITTLPSSICKLKSLRLLALVECSKFSNFPEILEDMPNLRRLELVGTAITTFPSSLCKLESLCELSLIECQKLTTIPDVVGAMTKLESLAFVDTALATLPSRIWQLKYYTTVLHLENCNLYEIPPEIKDISSLKSLYLCGNPFVSLPNTIKQLLELEVLDISNCKRLRLVPELPPSLRSLVALDCMSLERLTPFQEKILEVNFLYMGCHKLEGNHIWEILQTSFLGKIFASKMWGVATDRYLIPWNIGDCPFESIWYFRLGREIANLRSAIPEWFVVYQSRGSSLSFELPTDVLSPNLAFIFCLVVHWEESMHCFLSVKFDYFATPQVHGRDYFQLCGIDASNTKGSDQVIVGCVRFAPKENLYNDATDWTFFFDFSIVRPSLTILDVEMMKFKVKSCGVRVVDRVSGLSHEIRNFNVKDKRWLEANLDERTEYSIRCWSAVSTMGPLRPMSGMDHRRRLRRGTSR